MSSGNPANVSPVVRVPPSAPPPRRSPRQRLVALRGSIPTWLHVVLGLLTIALVFLAWFLATTGEPEFRAISPTILPSPAETFASFEELWFDRALTRNLFVTLRRVLGGFALACAVGIPLGVLSGCFPLAQGLLFPLTIFGRNIPLVCLIPLTFIAFGVGEGQKVMFIFIACVMFIVSDTATAIQDVDQRYVDTAWTLGAKKHQIITKVLVPLAMPGVFNSLRLLFGLAFGYIMLAELVKLGGEVGGLGDLIRQSQRRGIIEHIWLVLLIIPFVALGIDRALQAIQRSLFPSQYGGYGLLNRALRVVAHAWEDLKFLLKRFFFRPQEATVPEAAVTEADRAAERLVAPDTVEEEDA